MALARLLAPWSPKMLDSLTLHTIFRLKKNKNATCNFQPPEKGTKIKGTRLPKRLYELFNFRLPLDKCKHSGINTVTNLRCSAEL